MKQGTLQWGTKKATPTPPSPVAKKRERSADDDDVVLAGEEPAGSPSNRGAPAVVAAMPAPSPNKRERVGGGEVLAGFPRAEPAGPAPAARASPDNRHDDLEETPAPALMEESDEESNSGDDEEEEEEGGRARGGVAKLKPAAKKAAGTATVPPPSDAFDPLEDPGWERGQPVPYKALADTFARIEGTSSRLHIIAHLANLFRSIIALSPHELLTVIYLSTNQLGPAFEGLELGIGESIIMKAIRDSCGKTKEVLAQRYKELGDLGLVAMASRQTQATLRKPAPLSLQKVFKNFRDIAQMTGTKSGDQKCNIIKSMLVAAQGNETRYIVRSLQGKLRIGLAAKSVLVAVTHALVLTPPDAQFPPRIKNRHREGDVRGPALKALLDESVATVKEVYSEVPSYEAMLPVLLNTTNVEYGQTIRELRERCQVRLGVVDGCLYS